MNYLAVEGLSKSFVDKMLFEDLTFYIDKGQKVSFVAQNGSGKSSLMKIIMGNDTPDKGSVYLRPEIVTGYLEQDPHFPAGQTVLDAVFDSDSPAIKAIKQYEHYLENPDDMEGMEQAMAQMDATQAWDIEVKAKQILGTFNIHNFDQDVSSLSGGQRKRIALAKVLIDEPDFLIMDEPTNHLDLDMIEWLEQFLTRSNMTIFMVTHDRYFLDNVSSEIMELENSTIYKYKGNYGYYLEKKAEREASLAASVDKAKNLYRTELEWMRRMPQGRGTKAKARIDAFYDTKDKAHTKLDKEQVQLHIKMNRLGGKVLELHHVSKSFGGKNLIEDFSYKFREGERVGVVGKNGAGKSTFLNMLTGKLQPDTGKVVEGKTIVFGYYSQEGMKLDEDKRVIEVVKEIAEFIPIEKGKTISASAFLERFLFTPEQQFTPVSKLSGGEKRRLYLMTVLMKNPNFLILDEPTNDLDIITLNVLEDFLLTYPGCLLIVSHDRHFMDKLTEHIFVLEGEGKIKDYNGTYSEYRYAKQKEEQARKQQEAEAQKQLAKQQPQQVQAKPTGNKKKLSYNEQRELQSLGPEIEELENEKKKLTDAMSSGTMSGDEIVKAGEELAKVVETLDTKSERWMELAELAEQFGQTDLL